MTRDSDSDNEMDMDHGSSRPHVVVVNRWGERYAEYERYLDHHRLRVTYVTTEVGLGSVPASAAATFLVGRTDDLDAVRAAVRSLVARYGRPLGVVALKEDDLLVGAQLRDDWGCAGPRPQQVHVFRDKALMCEAVRRAGLPVPAFAVAPDAAAVRDFAAAHGWPVIVKPRGGSSSEGVVRLDGPADLAALSPTTFTEPPLVQAYCADPIHHVDGVFDGRDVALWRGSRYVNDCLGFRRGVALGSVEDDDPVRRRALGQAATGFLRALGDQPTVFHLEVFVGADDLGRPRITFLEVGARTGGGEIPFVWREVHGYDLVEAAACLQLGRPVPPVPSGPPGPDDVGGFLLVPAPASRPCRITSATPMVGRVPGPYAERVLRPGQVLPAADSYYEHVGGRFRFRGSSTAEVERAVRVTAASYHVTAEPVLATDRSPRPRPARPLEAAATGAGAGR